MSPESKEENLPFEPRRKKKKPTKKSPVTAPVADTKPKNSAESKKANKPPFERGEKNASLSAIPDGVSKRMVRRMALFSGIPTALGISSFVVFYLIVSNELFKVPTTAVLLVSLGFFGLGVLGLSYGILSTSWDEDRLGSWFGFEEFTLNFGRMTSAWRAARKEAK